MVVTFRQEYHTLCKAMDRLNYLGKRIYLDALWLAVDKEESVDAWTELGKVEGLIQAVNNLWKKWKSQFREREACNDEPSLTPSTTSKTTSGNRREVVMGESDDPEEVVVKFLVPQSVGLDEDDNDDEDEEDDVEITISTCWEGEEEEEEVLLQEVTSQGGVVSNLLVPSLRNDKEKRTSSGLDQPHPDDGDGGDVDGGGGGGGNTDFDDGGGDDDEDAFNSGLTVGEPNEKKTTDSDLSVSKKKRRYKYKTKPIPSKNVRFPQSEKHVSRAELIEELGISPSFINMGKVSTVVCPVCNKVFSRNNIYPHLRFHVRQKNGNKPELCNLCGKEVTNLKSHLRWHRVAAITTRNFKCTHCPKDFRTASSLRSHVTRMHGPPESCICDVCGKVFKFRHSLIRHQKFVHNREQEGVCPYCHKTFKCNLKRHLRIHTSTGAYPCSVCGKVFSTVDRHYYHENRHTSNFPYPCSLCDYPGFRTSRWLEEHMRKRHPNGEKIVKKKKGRPSMRNGNRSMASDSFKCQTCGKEFKFPTNLSRHNKAVHGGLKPFSCHVCARAFATKNILITHLWTHSTSKKYPCVLCDKGFNDRRHLVSHVKRDHPEYNLPLPDNCNIPPQEFQHLPHLRPDPRYRNKYTKPAKIKNDNDGQLVENSGIDHTVYHTFPQPS